MLESAGEDVNLLEMTAAFFAICKAQARPVILLLTDNVSVVAHVHINHMGGTRSPLLHGQRDVAVVSSDLEEYIVVAQHLPGLENVTADFLSRHLSDRTNWMLNPEIFQCINNLMGPIQVHLFATHFTYSKSSTLFQLETRLRGRSEATDAFQQVWSTRLGFAHPPWCIIARTLAKILREEATAIMVTPVWHTQAWFPTLLEMLQLVNYPPLLGIKFSADVAEVQCKVLSKTARPGQEKIFQAVTISCFKEDTSLCPVSCRITTLRGDTGQLFLSSVAPHRPVSSSTISRCSTEFTGHSTRAAFSTAAALNGVSIHEVMERACWSNEDTFCKHYCRPSAQAKLAAIMGHQSSHK